VVNALYIPLADHYAALVAYEKYRDQMQHADFNIHRMKNWDLLRARFQEGEMEMAFVMTPLALDMFVEKPDFRWIGLMHRDGNALAINDQVMAKMQLEQKRQDRKPGKHVADAFSKLYQERNKATRVGVPHLLSTHSVVMYQFLKNHGLQLTMNPRVAAEVLLIPVAPPKAPLFLKSESNRATPAGFEQSLPWADVVETQGYGHVAWYSRDVIKTAEGHVECIILAHDQALEQKTAAIGEVMFYIKKAGQDIEKARATGEGLEDIVNIVRKHIPAHTRQAIIASLNKDQQVINYNNLNTDKPGIKQIMKLAIEGGILKQAVNIEEFADERFDSN